MLVERREGPAHGVKTNCGRCYLDSSRAQSFNKSAGVSIRVGHPVAMHVHSDVVLAELGYWPAPLGLQPGRLSFTGAELGLGVFHGIYLQVDLVPQPLHGLYHVMSLDCGSMHPGPHLVYPLGSECQGRPQALAPWHQACQADLLRSKVMANRGVPLRLRRESVNVMRKTITVCVLKRQTPRKVSRTLTGAFLRVA